MENVISPPTKAKPTLKERLFAPTDIASLVFLRISLGFIYLAEVIRYFAYGWIAEDFIDPQVHFTYFGFSWVTPWPGWGMYVHFIVMGVAALGMILGCFYRISAILVFLTFTYVFLLDQALYLNHFYLMCLLALLMIFIPAHRAGSIDALRKPQIRTDVLPAWPRWLMLAFLSLVYFYAAVAKMNPDWFTGGALRIWLPRAKEDPLIGHFMDHEMAAYFFAYGGLAFDLFIVPLLLWRRTRWFGYLWVLAFHFLNFRIFNIGVFPWMMILATTLYFSPAWPRKWIKWPLSGQRATFNYSPLPLRLGAAFLILQALIPFRHLLYPGPVNWNEEGHRFSWHMMLRTKSGTAAFIITDPVTKESWEVRPRDYLTRQQARKTATRPDMLLQFAHYLAKAEAASHNTTHPLEVRVISRVALDGRPEQPMVYSHIDLAKVRRHLGHNDWIVPLLSEEEIANLPEEPRARRKDTGRSIATPSTIIPPFDRAMLTNSSLVLTSLLSGLPASNRAVLRLPPEKVRLLERDAERGDARAQYELGRALSLGTAGITNMEKSFFWTAKAAEAGIPEAQYRAAVQLTYGEGTETNLVAAMKWASLSARQSHSKAAQLKEELRDSLTPFQAALAKRLVSDYLLTTRTNGNTN